MLSLFVQLVECLNFSDCLFRVLTVEFGIHLFQILLLELLDAVSFGYFILYSFLIFLYFLPNLRVLILVSFGDRLYDLDLIFRHFLRQLPYGLLGRDLEIVRKLMILVIILEEL